MNLSFLFVGKKNDPFCEQALEFTRLHVPKCEAVLGRRGDDYPGALNWWQGDVILSYLSPWVLPGHLLRNAGLAALNFHPGPPEYPGIGCTNFAIYNGEKAFGVTCHHMAEQVDSGPIVAVKRFPLRSRDTVLSLTRQCYGHMLSLFYDILGLLLDGNALPASPEQWRRRPYRRNELDGLCRITADMPGEEIRRRIRAVTYPQAPGAFLELSGIRFEPVRG